MKQYHLKCWPAKDLGVADRGRGGNLVSCGQTRGARPQGIPSHGSTGQTDSRLRAADPCPPGVTVMRGKRDASRSESSAGEQGVLVRWHILQAKRETQVEPRGAHTPGLAGAVRDPQVLSGTLQAVPDGAEELRTALRGGTGKTSTQNRNSDRF